MLGFSLTKIFVLAAIVLAVWYGFKFVSRLDKRRKEEIAEAKRVSAAAPSDAGDMIKCPKCDAFVVARGAMNCGRHNCPY
ncbi:MAG: hypothetical protein VW835_20160 [Rickettsiales bacterium]|jgi:hypothetical protein